MEQTTLYQSADSEVGQTVVVLGDEEAHSAVLTAEGIVDGDVVESTAELRHIDSFEVKRVFLSSVRFADLQPILGTL